MNENVDDNQTVETSDAEAITAAVGAVLMITGVVMIATTTVWIIRDAIQARNAMRELREHGQIMRNIFESVDKEDWVI